MRVMVTGHRGYVGSVLLRHLVGAGHEVVGLDACWFEASRLGEPLERIHEQTGDIRDLARSDLAGVEAVIHLAGLSNDPLGDLNPALTQSINGDAAVRLASLARDAGVRRFLAASSCSVYGAAGDRWIDESGRPAPVTPYASAKWFMEQGLMPLKGATFEPVIVRPGTVYGHSPMLRFDLVLNNLVAWALATGKVHFKSDGHAWRPLLHVQDLCAAMTRLLMAPSSQVSGRAFNVGFNDQNRQVIDLGPIIQRHLPGTTIAVSKDPARDTRSYRVDCTRLARLWNPDRIMDLDQGVSELIRRLGATPAAVDEFEGGRFQRVAQLKLQMASGQLDADLRVTTGA